MLDKNVFSLFEIVILSGQSKFKRIITVVVKKIVQLVLALLFDNIRLKGYSM